MKGLAFWVASFWLCLMVLVSACSSEEMPTSRSEEEKGGPYSPSLRARIHPDLSEFSFTLKGEALDASSKIFRVRSIVIYRAQDASPVQIIEGLNTETPVSDTSFGLEILDMNFDKYGDLRIVEFSPAGPNVPYLNWLFDPATAQFVRTDELDAITSPVFDRKTGRIRSSWRDGANRYGTDVYLFMEGKPVLVRKELKEYLKPGVYQWIVSEWIEGKWKTVEQKVVQD